MILKEANHLVMTDDDALKLAAALLEQVRRKSPIRIVSLPRVRKLWTVWGRTMLPHFQSK